jgi:hypothetical protein
MLAGNGNLAVGRYREIERDIETTEFRIDHEAARLHGSSCECGTGVVALAPGLIPKDGKTLR